MAVVKRAVVRGVKSLGAGAQWLELEAAEPLGFAGGQYVIVDSGLVRPNGKAAKRAYSPITSDVEQARFELVVKRIEDGLSSNFMHQLQAGDSVSFSGPWGKWAAPSSAGGHTLVLATDTGVTAALGLLHSRHFAPRLPSTSFVWLRVDDADFVTDDFVRERLPRACGEFRPRAFPPVHHPERLPVARQLLTQILSSVPITHARLCGDAVINYGLMDDLMSRGIPMTRDDVESFFNMPVKSQ